MIIKPDWPAPENVFAASTTRQGGVSLAPFDSFNLAQHVGDLPKDVEKNRTILRETLALPSEPLWLNQTHSSDVSTGASCEADAAYTHEKNTPLVIMTADCLPILLCDTQGIEIAAIHAGWRGLAHGVVENTLKHFSAKPENILAWLGPAIGPSAFEVGQDVYDAFIQHDTQAVQNFTTKANGKYLCDIYGLAKQRLNLLGVQQISGGDFCTYTDKQRFYSYRRDQRTGRMAHLICLNQAG